MNFTEAYNFITSLENLPRKEYLTNPHRCNWFLQRLQYFLDKLGNPERKIPHYIHVTGTSGKGSVTTYLHNILLANGARVASTYSPHPTTITERWKIGNCYMTKKEFAELVTFIKPKLDEYINDTPFDMLSFFEITEAIGLLFFARHKVQWAVMEVACGGRNDSSNIIPWKDAAIITNIGLDHVGIIGKNKKEIAYEKAGIIKKGCQVFTAEKNKKIRQIFAQEIKKCGAKPLTTINSPKFTINKKGAFGVDFVYQNEKYHLHQFGDHQIHNAILCSSVAKNLKIPITAIKKGLAQTSEQPLRLEIISHRPYLILDGAHNPDKMQSTVDGVKNLKYHNLNLLIGFSGDKNFTKMIQQLATLNPKTIAITRNTTNQLRKVADPKIIATTFQKILPKAKIKIFLDPFVAWCWVHKHTARNDALLATGSIFVSGELRGLLKPS